MGRFTDLKVSQCQHKQVGGTKRQVFMENFKYLTLNAHSGGLRIILLVMLKHK